MYVDNVYQHDGSQNARLFSETVPSNHAQCMRFYYTLTGADTGEQGLQLVKSESSIK